MMEQADHVVTAPVINLLTGDIPLQQMDLFMCQESHLLQN